MKNFLSLAILLAVVFLGCSKEPESVPLNAVWSLKNESEQIFKDSDATRVAVVLEFECPEKFPGPAQMSVNLRDLNGEVIPGVIPSFSIVDEEKKRTFYFYVKQSVLERYPLAVLHATVSSAGFRPITVIHTFEATKQT